MAEGGVPFRRLKQEPGIRAALPYARHVTEDVITLDSGTTNREIARRLLETAMEATVITNSQAVIATLAAAPGITLYASGGLFHPAKSAFIDRSFVVLLKRFSKCCSSKASSSGDRLPRLPRWYLLSSAPR